jgi:5'-nucleotidase/UDP-sugar diphosphatase
MFNVARFHRLALASAVVIASLLPACSSDNDVYPELELTIAHINDHHSNLDPIVDQEITVDGVKTRVELGGMTRIAQAFANYAGRDNVLKLHAGDAITGTSYFTFFKGEADAVLIHF